MGCSHKCPGCQNPLFQNPNYNIGTRIVNVDELATELEGTAKIVKVNVDNCPAISAQYQVMSIPTLILFKDGQIVQQTVGFQPKASLLSLIQSNK